MTKPAHNPGWGDYILPVEVPAEAEKWPMLHTIIPFDVMAYLLALKLNVGDALVVGAKITQAV